MNWIKCTERMPEPGVLVLVLVKRRCLQTDEDSRHLARLILESRYNPHPIWRGQETEGDCDDPRDWHRDNVTHWAPLPDVIEDDGSDA